MAAFDADLPVDNSNLKELKILNKKVHTWEKKGILYFERDGIEISMNASVKNKNGKETGTIHSIAAKTTDGDPIWDMGGLKYDWTKFWKQVSKNKFDKIFDKFIKDKDTIWGSHLDDVLHGGKGNDTIKGWRGDDIINGGKGKDKLIGHIGADTFVFDQKLKSDNKDHIKDFHVGEDMIELKSKIFTELDIGDLKADYFTIGKNAVGDNPQIIYQKNKGNLFYDPDGAGGADKVKFATVTKDKDITHDNFFVT